ncbi:MAG: ROK family protein [Bacteroidales bacterium]|jgi:glucokinase|nr:ROK family protein [Bacteroidales bacterium]
MQKEAVVGIDIGGTFTKFAIVDRLANIMGEGSIPTSRTNDAGEYVTHLANAVNASIQEVAGQVVVKGIGIGAPNSNYKNGCIEYAVNLTWAHGKIIPFVQLFKQHFNMPVAITNDANAAALGEMIYGGAKEMKDFILITLGTGLGSGLVVNGELLYGHDGLAGEIGHVRAKDNGRICSCGRRGCLETYVSAQGIKRTVFELLAEYTNPSELRNYSFNDLTSETIYHAATRNDPIALKAFEITGELLGVKLADAVAHTSPQAIFLFGGLAKSGDYILRPTRESFEKNLLKNFQKVPVIMSLLTEGNVAVLGASALIWQELNLHAHNGNN